jgi:DNA-binding transcriptional MerR regulator
MNETQLRVADVAGIAMCHRSTVLRYERKGLIHSLRDNNGFRRFSLEAALKLKNLLSLRVSDEDQQVGGSA